MAEVHLATVHFGSDRWIAPQRHFLARFAGGPIETWAVLAGIRGHEGDYDHVIEGADEHADNLDLLADAILGSGAADDDVIVFLDGDAFPVAPLVPAVADLLSDARLAAVRRDENLGDPFPHPCFCATTAGLWRELDATWSPDPELTNDHGQSLYGDPGGVLLGQLERAGIGWTKLLRSNIRDPHPLFFGVYGGLVYHHGAGFRDVMSRRDMAEAPADHGLAKPWHKLWVAHRARRNRRTSERWLRYIERDPEFFGELTG